MDSKNVLAAGLISLALSGWSTINPEPLPEGWLVNGGLGSWLYTTTIDHRNSLSPHGAKLIKSSYFADQDDSFCAISQHLNPVKYRGQRIRFSAMVSVDEAASGATLYVRADTPVTMAESLAQTQENALRGSQSWRLHELVIDVPKDAILLSFGMMLVGRGSARMDNLRLEIVDAATPLTDATTATRRLFLDGLPVDLTP